MKSAEFWVVAVNSVDITIPPASGKEAGRGNGRKHQMMIKIRIILSQAAEVVKTRFLLTDGERRSYNHGAAGNGCKQGEQYAMVEPAGRKEGRWCGMSSYEVVMIVIASVTLVLALIEATKGNRK